MSGSDDASDDPNLVVVPLDDDLSDGKKETWPLHDAKFVYTAIDDTSWRSFLATKLVEENGASEDGKLTRDGLPPASHRRYGVGTLLCLPFVPCLPLAG